MVMYTDFQYDGLNLSDFGFTICDFNGSSGINTVSAGSKITFKTVSRHKGKKYSLTGTQYDECIQAKFQICKNLCEYEDLKITDDEFTDLMRWLNRHEFLPFHAIGDEEERTCYYEASFNINKITIGHVLYGLELTMETNKPFGYGEEQTIIFDIADTSNTYTLVDISDEIGYIYPNIVATCKSSGDLEITNHTEGISMVINNCSSGEVITIDGSTQILLSSLDNHYLYDDFNYEFFRIGNTFDNRENIISSTLPCTLEINYKPIIKNSPEL